jgi:hypothetical protein
MLFLSGSIADDLSDVPMGDLIPGISVPVAKDKEPSGCGESCNNIITTAGVIAGIVLVVAIVIALFKRK